MTKTRKARKLLLPIECTAPGKYLFRNQYEIVKEGSEWVIRIGSALAFRGATVGGAARRAVDAGY